LIAEDKTLSTRALSDNLNKCGTLGTDIEKYLNTVFLDKLRMSLSPALFTELQTRINPADSLASRCTKIRTFHNEYESELRTIDFAAITVNNQAIVSHLQSTRKINPADVKHLNNPDFKKAMDALASHEMIPWLKNYGEEFLEVEKDIKNCFQNALSLL